MLIKGPDTDGSKSGRPGKGRRMQWARGIFNRMALPDGANRIDEWSVPNQSGTPIGPNRNRGRNRIPISIPIPISGMAYLSTLPKQLLSFFRRPECKNTAIRIRWSLRVAPSALAWAWSRRERPPRFGWIGVRTLPVLSSHSPKADSPRRRPDRGFAPVGRYPGQAGLAASSAIGRGSCGSAVVGCYGRSRIPAVGKDQWTGCGRRERRPWVIARFEPSSPRRSPAAESVRRRQMRSCSLPVGTPADRSRTA